MIEAEKTYEHILFEQDGAVAYVTMNRPKKRNALSLEHMRELISLFEEIGERRDASVVILRGEGPAFCAGHDLSEMIGRDPGFYRHIFDVCCELMETIQEIPQPVIAQVDGVATAAGCQLAATCDLVVASEEARFATPGVRIGLFCSTPMVALSRAVGQKKSMEMLLTGEFISAEEALRISRLRHAHWPRRSRSPALWSWGSASRHSIVSSGCLRSRHTPIPKRLCPSTPPSRTPRRAWVPSWRSASLSGRDADKGVRKVRGLPHARHQE
jgi:hypothetical protein